MNPGRGREVGSVDASLEGDVVVGGLELLTALGRRLRLGERRRRSSARRPPPPPSPRPPSRTSREPGPLTRMRVVLRLLPSLSVHSS